MSINFCEKNILQKKHKLLCEEYTPKFLNDILDNESIVEILNNMLITDKIPNLMLTGPCSCGKKTTTQIFVKNYLNEYYEDNCYILYGSIFRSKNNELPEIYNFIKKKKNNQKSKIIIIYDFDCINYSSQKALRRVMENYSQQIRFILICENLNNIIEPIQSRTLILKFHQITQSKLIEYLKKINFGKEIDEIIYEYITIIANCDLKLSLNYLQVFNNCPNKTIQSFYNIFNIPAINKIKQIIDYCIKQKFEAFYIMNELIDNGYSIIDILDIFNKILLYDQELKINTEHKIFMIKEINIMIMNNEIYHSINNLYKLLTLLIKKK